MELVLKSLPRACQNKYGSLWVAMTDLYLTSDEAIAAEAVELNNLSQDIWNRPELAFEETYAHGRLTEFLKERGFDVECQYQGIQTAFRASYGPKDAKPHVVIFCEYDALPDIGHGCGHNLIAEVGVAAGLGVKAAIAVASNPIGKVTILGSPAEEGGGGKILMINSGALNEVDAAIMSHPGGFNAPKLKMLSSREMLIRYHGKASHASAFPWEGVNALDAAVLCYQNLSCLRQQLKPRWQIMGIIKNGGAKPNIIPEFSELHYSIRAPSAGELMELISKVLSCTAAAARATGCQVEILYPELTYLNMIQNESLLESYLKHLSNQGVSMDSLVDMTGGSSDMGNVSYVVPSIHPMFDVSSGVPYHTRDFTSVAGDPKAQHRTIQEAKVLARVALDIMQSKDLLETAKKIYQKDFETNGGHTLEQLFTSEATR